MIALIKIVIGIKSHFSFADSSHLSDFLGICECTFSFYSAVSLVVDQLVGLIALVVGVDPLECPLIIFLLCMIGDPLGSEPSADHSHCNVVSVIHHPEPPCEVCPRETHILINLFILNRQDLNYLFEDIKMVEQSPATDPQQQQGT